MPYVLDDTGLQIPTQPELLAEMIADYQSDDPAVGFGPDADASTDSGFYKVAQRVALQVAMAWQGLRDHTGQVAPENAVGQQLDRLGSLIDLDRRGRTRSTIAGRVIGTPGTTLTQGAVVEYVPLGTRWSLPAGTIPAGGILPVEATAVEFGPVDARIAGAADWAIVSGQVNGWTAFDSVEHATLGDLAEDDAEYRPQFRIAARGLATYDAIVNEVRAVANVTTVSLYVNTKLDPDPVTGLLGKQVRLIVRGGARLDIAAALHRALGAPVDTVGAVLTQINPGNGQVLDYRFDRLKRRRGYLRLTYHGGNPLAPLPPTDEVEAIVLKAVADVVPEGGKAFNPFVFGVAGLVALLSAVPGSVTKMVAEGRLSELDPWVEDAIVLPLDEVIDVATSPTVAEALSVAEDPIVAAAGSTFWMGVNGQAPTLATLAVQASGSAAIAGALQSQFSDVTIDSVDGRVRVRTVLTGDLASLEFPVDDSLNGQLGLALLQVTGSDGDVEVVVVP